ncbi:GLPGLI family protein [Pedobacter gandavensis]|uniref:GLPGLI family protein n=1 Tax=Pedobacter gandavensis TaxID=2679963 RepID=UPI00292DA6EB|nr:GLPGLI family protein [Pedobacter gandavensis]
MKQFLIAISFCCLSSFTFGQKKDKELSDDVNVRCYYLFSKKKDTNSPVFRRDTMALDIGKQVSRFYDPARLGRDSALADMMTSIRGPELKSVSIFKDGKQDLSKMPGTKQSNTMEGESYQIVKDKQTGLITVFDYINTIGAMKFQYEDQFPKLNWQLVEGTDTIATYVCQKAVLKFRGRNYTAWFSPEIPINDGPWKFAGLPGLILKVEDADQIFSFTLIGMTQPKTPIPMLITKSDYLKCTRAEFAKQLEKQGLGAQINFTNGAMIVNSFPGKYEPTLMELE